MNLDLTFREKWSVRAIYMIVSCVTLAALFMAFDHARNWADRHSPPGEWWTGWAFAAMIELPALMALLLLQVWSKLAGGRKPVVPRVLLAVSYSVSLAVQQAYAGADASFSTRIVAGLPSLGAGVFVEIMFMLLGFVDAVATKIAAEEMNAREETRQRLGLGDIAAPPTLTPPVMSGHADPDMSPDTTRSREHDISPDTRPDMSGSTTRHDSPTPTGQAPDIPQVTGHVRSEVGPDRPWADLPDIDPDSEAAERVAPVPDVLPPEQPRPERQPDKEPDIGEDDKAPDVIPTPDTRPDTGPDTAAKWTAYPLGPKAAEMRRNGATLKAIGEAIGKTERTLSRWELPEPERVKPANGHDLTGVNH